MFERFTEHARQVVALAQEEARTLKHDYIGTEHILLGLVRERDGVAAQVLDSFDITIERARGEVVRIVGIGADGASGQIPFTPRATHVLELALGEAVALGENYIGTEHVLLALLSVGDSTSVRILRDCEAEPDRVRSEVLRIVARPPEATQPAGAPTSGQPAPGSEQWFHVGPAAGVRRLLMIAAARALDDGRSGIESRDVLLALTRDEKTGPVLADLGVDEAAVLKAIERRRQAPPPPRASAGG